MAVDDLANIQLVLVGIDFYQCNLGMRSTSGVANWREILLTGFAALVVPVWMAGLSNRMEVWDLRIQDVVPGTDPDVIHTYVTPPVGGVNSPPIPFNAAAKLLWRTALQGRSHKGCNFIAGMPQSRLVDTGMHWTVDGQNYLEDVVDTIIGGYGPTGTSTFGRFCIISRTENGAPRAVPIGTDVVSGDDVSEVRTMRRRAD